MATRPGQSLPYSARPTRDRNAAPPAGFVAPTPPDPNNPYNNYRQDIKNYTESKKGPILATPPFTTPFTMANLKEVHAGAGVDASRIMSTKTHIARVDETVSAVRAKMMPKMTMPIYVDWASFLVAGDNAKKAGGDPVEDYIQNGVSQVLSVLTMCLENSKSAENALTSAVAAGKLTAVLIRAQPDHSSYKQPEVVLVPGLNYIMVHVTDVGCVPKSDSGAWSLRSCKLLLKAFGENWVTPAIELDDDDDTGGSSGGGSSSTSSSSSSSAAKDSGPKTRKCPHCGGKGESRCVCSTPKECKQCGGSKKVACKPCKGSGELKA